MSLVGRGRVAKWSREQIDRLTTPEALHEFAAENLFTPEFGVPEEFVEYARENGGATVSVGGKEITLPVTLTELSDAAAPEELSPSGSDSGRNGSAA